MVSIGALTSSLATLKAPGRARLSARIGDRLLDELETREMNAHPTYDVELLSCGYRTRDPQCQQASRCRNPGPEARPAGRILSGCEVFPEPACQLLDQNSHQVPAAGSSISQTSRSRSPVVERTCSVAAEGTRPGRRKDRPGPRLGSGRIVGRWLPPRTFTV